MLADRAFLGIPLHLGLLFASCSEATCPTGSRPDTLDGEETCVETFCGDGFVDEAEECDEGPDNSDESPDACRTSCASASCGDGTTDSEEECDEGDENGDSGGERCRFSCRLPACGDGILDRSEGCDEGDANSDVAAGACRTDCVSASCGDGVLDPLEQCDQGGENSDSEPDACRTTCLSPTCGDGVVDFGETCDEAELNDDDRRDACRTTCRPASCGDGVVDTGEGCDDGDFNSDLEPDACRTICVPADCGDGVIDNGEQCDDGDDNRDSMPNSCRTRCVAASCGDGVIDLGEACDDGADNGDDNPEAECRTTCVLPTCGDGHVDAGEECDDGPLNSDETVDACRSNCVTANCGDGVVDSGEECDDAAGNSAVEADACRLSCRLPACGDGVSDTGESCDAGLANDDDLPDACRTDCSAPRCGDGVIDSVDGCDDGNGLDDDGCDADCVPSRVVQVSAGGLHTCVLLRTGAVRCWGHGGYGQLGYENDDTLGDEDAEMPPPNVDLGGSAVAVVAADLHTCALMEDGAVRCWGWGMLGRLGQGGTETIGDDPGEMPPAAIDIGGPVESIAVGASHGCALLDAGTVRCWGSGSSGKLGYGNADSVGDGSGPMPPGDVIVALGRESRLLAAGARHSCVMVEPAPDTANVYCWGEAQSGQLGRGSTEDVGDEPFEMPPGGVRISDAAESISAGSDHTCALLPGGAVQCWGSGGQGRLGYGATDNIGDDPGEQPADVEVGGPAVAVEAGINHTCAIMAAGTLRCWGGNFYGQLGYGDTDALGDGPDEMPPPEIDVGGLVEAVSAGDGFTCAILDNGSVRCWGSNESGQLGYGNRVAIGDDETPNSAGDVRVF